VTETEVNDDDSRSRTTTRRCTTAGDIGWLLEYVPGQRIQQLEFQFCSEHRRKPTASSRGLSPVMPVILSNDVHAARWR